MMYYKELSPPRKSRNLMRIEEKLLQKDFKRRPWTVPRKSHLWGLSSSHCAVCPPGFQADLKPLFLIARALGLLPLYFYENGVVEFRLMSAAMLYTVAVVGAMVVLTAFTILDRINLMKNGMSFEGMVLEFGCIICISFVFLVPTNHLPESSKKAKFLTSWNDLQTEYRRVTGRVLELKIKRQARVRLVISTVIPCVFTGLLFSLQRGWTWWQGIPLFYNTYMSCLMTDFWVMTMQSFTTAVHNMECMIREDLCIRSHRVEEYTQLWCLLSKQMQDMGDAMGWTFGGQILIYTVLQLTGIFGFISQLNMGNTFITTGFFVTAVTFSWMTFVLCNASENATKAVGSGFQDTLRSIIYHVPMDTDTKAEMRAFIGTITECPPVISLSGFVQVNRTLQTSLMSNLVTYLVVLTQFQLSSSEDSENREKKRIASETTTE